MTPVVDTSKFKLAPEGKTVTLNTETSYRGNEEEDEQEGGQRERGRERGRGKIVGGGREKACGREGGIKIDK